MAHMAHMVGPFLAASRCLCHSAAQFGREGPSVEEIRLMRSPLRARMARLLGAGALAAALVLPAGTPVAAADPVVLTVGLTQDLDAANPFNTALVSGYEAFELSYSLLTDFDKDAHPAPGFADSWERSPDKVTYHIRDGMKFSDGTPATSKDVCFSWGLAMAAIEAEANIGLGYLDPGLSDAGITKVECPDPSTFIAYTTDQSDRIFQIYVPILPEHIWGKYDYKTIADQKFAPPLVGTGPYQLVEWSTGQFARFVRNPNWYGQQGFADEVVLRFFPDQTDVMVQALKAGELDYAHDVNADQFKALATDPLYATVAGKANGWSQLAFNTYGTGTDKTIKGGGPSTKALLDPKFRDALGYAVDHQVLVDRVLGGYGDVGSTIVPPVLADWHVEPTTPRHFDIELAKQKLDAAGYTTDASGNRLDKEGEPIVLRLGHPNTNDTYAKSAQFVKEWYSQLGIDVSVQSYDSDTLTNLILPPPDGKANYDIELWGWSGSPDPNGLTIVFRCDQIGNLSDSQYCNPAYDELYDKQSTESGAQRHETLAQMQNLIYDEAPYDVLYYDANLDVYRTDRFAGWQNMPADGTPFFSYGILDYTLLTDATAQPSPTPEAPASSAPAVSAAPGSATPAPSTATTPGSTTGSGSDSSLLLLVGVVAVVVVVGGFLLNRRRRGAAAAEDE
jgi:peptide/nickel transport system substrate-binding protein